MLASSKLRSEQAYLYSLIEKRKKEKKITMPVLAVIVKIT